MIITIGSRDYRLKDWARDHAETASRFGQCDTNQGIIYVDESLTDDKKAVTLLHEIMHAVWVEWCLNDDDKEERIVDAMAKGLTQTLRDNPELQQLLSGMWAKREAEPSMALSELYRSIGAADVEGSA